MRDKSNRGIFLVGIITSIIMVVIILIGFQPQLNKNNDYIKKYKSIIELEENITFKIELPTFIYNEDSLYIESIIGRVIEIRNNEFRIKASEFVDFNADVLGIYDEFSEDIKFNIEDNAEKYRFFRYRNTGMQTIINWVKDNTSYGMVLDKVVSIDEAKEIVGLGDVVLQKYTEVATYEKEETSNYQMINNANIKFYIPDDIEFNIEEVYNEAIYYFADNKLVLVVAYNNPNKYLETYSDTCENKLYNGVYFIYQTLDKINEKDTDLINYYKFLVTIDEILESIELINAS